MRELVLLLSLPTNKAIQIPEKFLSFIRYIGACSLVVLSIFGTYVSVTRALADLAYKENTIGSLRRAARLDPHNAAVPIALGIQTDLAGDDPASEFRAATRLDPLLTEPWLRLGLLAEARGDMTSAEHLLLHAAEIDHQLTPRSTLMNFYARRAQPAAFWPWARLAFERSYGDSSSLFDLCWRMAADPAEVYEKAIPRTHDVLRSYLGYLVFHGRLPAARQPARDLSTQAVADDRGLLLEYCERVIDVSPADALWVWNESCRRGILPYEPLHPEQSPAVVNPTFTNEPLQKAFDWNVMDMQQISTARLPGGGIQFSFSGRQPEAVEIMAQTFPVIAGRSYRLTLDYRTEAIATPTGILVVAEDRQGARPLASAALPASDAGGRQSFGFQSPASGLVTLRLRYRRPLGSVRAEGTFTVRSVRLEAAH
jgi:hypothetical protein